MWSEATIKSNEEACAGHRAIELEVPAETAQAFETAGQYVQLTIGEEKPGFSSPIVSWTYWPAVSKAWAVSAGTSSSMARCPAQASVFDLIVASDQTCAGIKR